MDVWKIGVRLSLENQISSGIALIAGEMMGLKGKADEVQKAFTSWNFALNATVAIIAGRQLIDGMVTLVDHGRELVHVQEQLAAAGVNQIEVAEATGEAWKVAAKYGLNVSSVLGELKESRLTFGSTEHAIQFIDPLERMRVVINAVSEKMGDQAVASVMGRAGEMKGLVNPEDFQSYFDQMTKAVTASGGKVSPELFMQATQYGRLATKGWSEEFYTRYLPSLIQEYGGSGAGTSLMSLFGTIAQGKVTKRSLGMMDDIGLIADPSKITYNRLGDPMGMSPGAIAGTDLFIKDPYRWTQDVLKPLIEKKLGHAVHPGDQQAIRMIGGMFGNRNAAQMISTFLLEGQRLDKDASLIGQAKGLEASSNLLAHDPTTAMNNFRNSWDNLLTALGAPLVAPAVTGMNRIADVLKNMTEQVNRVATAENWDKFRMLMGPTMAGMEATFRAIGTIVDQMVTISFKVKDALGSIVSAFEAFIGSVRSLASSLGIVAPGSNPNVTPGNRAPGAGQQQWQAPGPGGRGAYSPTNWAPPANGNQPVQIHTALNVDGRRLANAVSTHVARNSAWSSSSSSFDGRAMAAPTDVNFI
jgi:hypothetical protein